MMYVWQRKPSEFYVVCATAGHHSPQVEELQANMNLSSRRAASQLQSAIAWGFELLWIAKSAPVDRCKLSH